jgi:transposase InsO family protein
VTQDDLLYRFRLRTLAIAAELGNVRAACRAMGIHPSTSYRWKHQLDRHGPEILRPRERRAPRMANATSVLVEQRVAAFALGHPGFGPARIAAELAQPNWGGIVLSTNGVGRVLRRHGLSTRAKRYGLVAGYAAPPELQRPAPPPEQPLDVDHPGQLVQLDCFCIGRLQGTKGTVWQYTAIDVASAYSWAILQVTRRNPSATWTSQLARTVAADLAQRGWKLERVMSDNASEFRSAVFGQAVATLGVRHTFIRAGRPQTNGCMERVQQTILDECWKPAFARYLDPQADRSSPRPGTLPALLQHRAGTHWPLDQGTHTRSRPREGQAMAQEALIRRHNSRTGQTKARIAAAQNKARN